jgi:polysaccharide export outer membrane protein
MLATASLLFLAAAASAGLKIDHQPVDCIVKDRFAQIDAAIDPTDDVMKARLYFKSALDTDYYYVDMALMQGRFVGKLPKPKDKAGPITYFIEAIGWKDQNRRTAEFTAQLAVRREACADGAKVAAEGSGDDVRVTSTSSSRLKPQGFKGIASVTVLADNAASGDTATTADAASTAKPPAKADKDKKADKPAEKPAGKPQEAVQPPPVPKPSPTPAAKPTGEDDYQIGAQDILKITVFGHDDLTQAVIVQNDGTFFFSLVGRVKASDMSPKELERKLTTLLAQGYLRNPQVTVMVQEFRSKNVFVMGEVARPGPLPYTGNMTVMQMLAQVGATAGAGSEVMILRPLNSAQQGPLSLDAANAADPANKQAETLRVSIRDIQMGQLDKNILLKPNDTIFVTQAAKVFLLGEVRNPGPQTYVSGLTIRQAITNAGGFTQDASKGKIIIGRQVNGQFKEIKAKPEDTVEAGDTITVKAKLF